MADDLGRVRGAPSWGAAEGWDETVARLVDRHGDGLFRLASCLLLDRAAAEQVTLDAFVAVHRSRPAPGSQTPVLPLLRAAVVDGCRSRQHGVVRLRALPPGPLSSQDGPGLVAALRSLPTRRREALVCREVLGMSPAQGAVLLGMSTRSVWAHAERATAVLRAVATTRGARTSGTESGLAAYADGLVLTDAEVERMQAALQRRLAPRSPRRVGRRPLRRVLPTAVATVAVAALAGTLSGRAALPQPAVEPTLAHEIVGVWKGVDAAFPWLVVFRADGGQEVFAGPDELLGAPSPARGAYHVAGNALVVTDARDPGVAACERSFTGQRLAVGRVRLTQASQSRVGCGSTPLPPFTMLRLSPASPASLAYAVAEGDAASPVTTTDPLDGTWLLRGTGTLVAIGRTRPPNGVPFRLDAKGAIDRSPEAAGLVTVPAPGRVVLTGAGHGRCAATVLAATAAGDYIVTTRVDTDPCGRLGAGGSLSWLRIQ